MIIWDIITVWLCKLIFKLTRLQGGHGAALPGLVAEKINPRLLRKLSDLPEGIIVVSGTNGKTTTTHLLSQSLTRMGKKVFTNHSGSNMTRGLLASIVRFSNISGKLNYDIAVLEIDEAYASKLAPILRPRACILTNVLRDQLDRFGEIDHTARLLKNLARQCTELVIYNATDKRLQDIPKELDKARPVSYGFLPELRQHFPDDNSLYDNIQDQILQKIDYELNSASESFCTIYGNNKRVTLDRSLLPGWHNVLNLEAVYALVTELYGVQKPEIFSRLTPPYGRGEVMKVGGSTLTLQLVKNPAGFRTAMSVQPKEPALIIINDLIADGRDVSWLWDVDVSTFANRPSVSVSGSRAYDMAVRLHYAEIKCLDKDINIENSLKTFIGSNESGVLYLTYTAMLQTRRILKSIGSS